MCLGTWSLLGYVKDHHITSIMSLPDLKYGAEEEVKEG